MVILTDFHSFKCDQDKLPNWSIFKFSAKIRVCDFGENLKMTKTSFPFIKKTLVNHVYIGI